MNSPQSIGLLMVLAMLGGLLAPAALHANTILVNTLDDPGKSTECTLRAAINNANNKMSDANSTCAAGSGIDTIVFGVSGTITLSGTLPAIANSSGGLLTIDGINQTITIDGASTYKVLNVNFGATLSLNDLTIAHGSNTNGNGGAINNIGTLTVTNCTFFSNTADSGDAGFGGAISNDGPANISNSTFSHNSVNFFGGGILNAFAGRLTVTNCTFTDNGAVLGGAGIYNIGAATVTNSSFSGNSTDDGMGGGIFNFGGTLSVSNCTFSQNSAESFGGGIDNLSPTDDQEGSTVTVTNSTFSGNSASDAGGGLDNEGGGTATVINCTFSGNSAPAGGGILNDETLTISNSVLANNTSGSNCGGSLTNGGYNISDDNSCGFGSSHGLNGVTIGDNVSDAHIALGALAGNGGPTETMALGAGSYAIDAVPFPNCPATDQRGNRVPTPKTAPASRATSVRTSRAQPARSALLVSLRLTVSVTRALLARAISATRSPTPTTKINRDRPTAPQGPALTISFSTSAAISSWQAATFRGL
jgi:CSLREA domain-containing protein